MLELAQLGARVMHPRAVELGEVYDMPILVASSFVDAPGTLITRAEHVEVRKNVRGIAHDTDVGKITVTRVPDRPGVAHAIFAPLADRRHQCGHHRPERRPGWPHRYLVHGIPWRRGRALPLVQACAHEMLAGGRKLQREPGQSLDRRDGHAERARLRRPHVRLPGRRAASTSR